MGIRKKLPTKITDNNQNLLNQFPDTCIRPLYIISAIRSFTIKPVSHFFPDKASNSASIAFQSIFITANSIHLG